IEFKMSAFRLSALILILLVEAAQVPSAAPAVSAPPTIVRVKSSTPFCQTFRDNVFHAVEGLHINDDVIDEGNSILAKWAYDSIVDGGKRGGASIKMDRYQLGLVVGQAAKNLQRVYTLLNDANRFSEKSQTDNSHDLLEMKRALEEVADEQERSLNLLSGTYETSAFYALLGQGSDTAGALQRGSIADKNLELGDPVFSVPGVSPPPVTASAPKGSLFAEAPVGRIRTAVTISQRLTGNVESHVGQVLQAGIEKCR
ncbi:MAG TPA: hypothetical protein VIX83_03730, partial [Candidatus Cybelea sp.]